MRSGMYLGKEVDGGENWVQEDVQCIGHVHAVKADDSMEWWSAVKRYILTSERSASMDKDTATFQ